ncbi:MAG: type II toxin-antitoxin system RelE/ParE family toxin [Erysipelotrichaceae bacterium]|nr:type II toxin-antitoxin system RelE/ParE family toxin [Erysipelotrichaceae bacterium]
MTRALYFFYVRKTIVITNGFVKKQQKTPPREISLAKERRADFLNRNKRDKIR